VAEDKLRLEIPVLLPAAAEACERCVQQLAEVLASRPGVAEAHVQGREDAVLCVHFDPAQISASQVRALAVQQGARLASASGPRGCSTPMWA